MVKNGANEFERKWNIIKVLKKWNNIFLNIYKYKILNILFIVG